MATGQSILDLMEVINAELQLQTGEADVTRALRALNAAQDHFESVVAIYPNVLGSTSGDLTTTAQTETTAFPDGVLRIDDLQFINPSTLRPSWTLDPIYNPGGHIGTRYWPWNVYTVPSGGGRPTGYWTNGRLIYWSPFPDGAHTIRWYGFQSADDLTTSSVFTYPDSVMLPLASFANQLMKIGLDDGVVDISSLAHQTFYPVIQTLSRFRREGPRGFTYRYFHET